MNAYMKCIEIIMALSFLVISHVQTIRQDLDALKNAILLKKTIIYNND